MTRSTKKQPNKTVGVAGSNDPFHGLFKVRAALGSPRQTTAVAYSLAVGASSEDPVVVVAVVGISHGSR